MLATSPFLSNKKSTRLTGSSDISTHSIHLSKSNIEPKSLQTTIDEMQQQITLFKQKAHQSFMQVIQIQQLHEEEIDQLRHDFQIKEECYQKQIKTMEVRLRQLEYQNHVLQKNYRQHSYNIEEKDLSIDNIELIACKEEDKLDESSILNFNEIIGNQSYYDQINSIHLELRKDFKGLMIQNQSQKLKVETMIEKLIEYFIHLKKEFVLLQELNSQAQKQLDENQKKSANSRILHETLEKEVRFLGEQVNRLGVQKIKAQKRIIQLQRKLKENENAHKKLQPLSAKNSPKDNMPLKKKESSDNSLDMNDFIQQKLYKTTNSGNSYKNPLFSKKIKN